MDTDTVMLDFSVGSTGSFDEEEPEQKFQDFQHEIRNPIVFTTKLDEMKIFRTDTTDMGVNTIINSIIKESKPKLNWKRKCTHTIQTPYSHEDLSCYINTLNRKVARIAEYNNNLLSMCKPVKVVLEDIKYTLLRKQTTEDKNSKIDENICPIVSDKPLSTYRPSCRLQTTIIYDLQLKEADMYSLDISYFIKEYSNFRMDKSNSNIYRSMKMDKNVSHISCCCWYNREKTLAMLPPTPHETLMFMRKPHTCAINLCRCCCRDKAITSPVMLSSLKPLEPHSIWLNRMTQVHSALPLSDKFRQTLLSKSMSAISKPEKHNNPVTQDTLPFLHLTNVDFGSEYYAIGADGQIKLYLKNIAGNDRGKLLNLRLKSANNIVGNICCWYKREEFAGRLLALGALRNVVNFIRSAHPCSSTNCSCCCKPSSTGNPQLTLLNKSARHTNDLVRKKVNIKVKFSGDAKKPTHRRNTNDFVSFNFSLSALEMISKSKTKPYHKDAFNYLIPKRVKVFDKNNSSVRVHVGKIPKHRTVIECTHLNNFTTTELKMLDIIFCAVSNAKKQQKEEKKTRIVRVVKKNSNYIYQTIYPLLLNKQLCITTDLRNKRFLPSLRDHLDKYVLPLPQMGNINVWVDKDEDANLEATNKLSVEFSAKAGKKKIKSIVPTNKRKRGK